MKELFEKIVKYLGVLITGVIIGLCINIPSCLKQDTKIITQTVTDTVTITKDRIIENTKILKSTDTIIKLALKTDTIIDSILVQVPMEHKLYTDTLKTDTTNTIINIAHHGIYSCIDSVSFNYNYTKKQEMIIVKPKKYGITWTLGPSVGFGFGYDVRGNKAFLGPQVGINLTIGFGGKIK